MRLRVVQRHAIDHRRVAQPRQRGAVQRQRARGQMALDAQVLQVRVDVGGS